VKAVWRKINAIKRQQCVGGELLGLSGLISPRSEKPADLFVFWTGWRLVKILKEANAES